MKNRRLKVSIAFLSSIIACILASAGLNLIESSIGTERAGHYFMYSAIGLSASSYFIKELRKIYK